MPIIGLTQSDDGQQIVRPTLLGMIRIGEKKVSQKGVEYPAKLDHFIFDPADPENADAILAEVRRVYGDNPKSIRVKFHSNNTRDIFDANYALWQASGCLCKGNGETALRLDDKYVQMREERAPKTGTDPGDIIEDENIEGETFTRVVCRTPEACPYAIARGQHGKPGCKQQGFLRVILPELPGLGVWGLSTGSINSIVQLNSAIHYLFGAFGGRLFGHEANLIVMPKQGIIPETQKRTTVYVLNLTTEHSFNALAQIASNAPALPAPGLALGHDVELDEDIDGNIIDADTGEVLHGPDLDVQIEDDPDVLGAMTAAGFSPAKKQAMLASASENNWTKDQLLDLIAKQTPASPPRRLVAAANAGAPVPRQQEIPVAAGNGSKTKRRFF